MPRYIVTLTPYSYGPASDRIVLVESDETDAAKMMAAMKGSFFLQTQVPKMVVEDAYNIDDLLDHPDDHDPVLNMKFVQL